MKTLHTPIELNGESFLVDEVLYGFEIFKKQSSNVDFFGVHKTDEKFFVQFKGGSGSYIYTHVNKYMIERALSAESIGKFIFSEITRKFPTEKYLQRMVKPAISSEPTF